MAWSAETAKTAPKKHLPKSSKALTRGTAAAVKITPKQRFLAIAERFAVSMPDPRCELYFKTPYQLLVSVILSAQTTDKMVNRCMQPIYEAGFTPKDAVALGAEGLLPKIKSIGLAPTKAKNVAAMSKILLEHHGGVVPENRAALEALPGVGRKTANVVLGEIFSWPTLAVDTHVFRVTERLGLQHETDVKKAELKLLEIIPASYLPRAHHWFILHGRYTCKASKPMCASCSVKDLCPYFASMERSAKS